MASMRRARDLRQGDLVMTEDDTAVVAEVQVDSFGNTIVLTADGDTFVFQVNDYAPVYMKKVDL
jgi:hypothetical protein